MRLQGQDAGKNAFASQDRNEISHQGWLEDVALRLVSVIARDRFGDFVSDQVVAPVRESASQALGAVLNRMDEQRVEKIINILLQLIKQENWQCRHGALLGVINILCVLITESNID